MSLIELFTRRGAMDDVGLPRQASDAELLEWGDHLRSETTRRARRTPLRAAPERPVRRRPLVAGEQP